MAASYFGVTPDPVDNDATGNPGPDVVFVPPASMLTGDLVLRICAYKSSSTTLLFNETQAGGQIWVPGAYNYGGATSALMSQYAYCIFNGTWDANPEWDMSNGGTSPMSGVIDVWRGIDTGTPIDVAEVVSANAAPGGSFDMSIAEITTITDNAMVVAHWFMADDNTCAIQTAGWTNPSGNTQWRNLSGADCGLSAAYKLITPAGATGAVVNRQTVGGGDAWNGHILALRPAAGGGGATHVGWVSSRGGWW